MDLIVFLFVVSCLVIGAVGLARVLTDGEWTDYYSQHKCGHIQRRRFFPTEICGRCGKQDDDWEAIIAKAKFPFGWHIKK